MVTNHFKTKLNIVHQHKKMALKQEKRKKSSSRITLEWPKIQAFYKEKLIISTTLKKKRKKFNHPYTPDHCW